jgi:CRISPR-associated protein Cmr2
MSEHLLVVSLGPVQDFIISARRTRDLWFGSTLLSEISKSVAGSIAGDGRDLIFPYPKGVPDWRTDRQFTVANIILAQLREGVNPEEVSGEAKEAAKTHWKEEIASPTKDRVKDFINDKTWDEQISDVLEFYSAWVPLKSASDYPAKRELLMRLLAGRKACRSFKQAPSRPGVPKSSLDGARETVWKDYYHLNLRDQIRVKDKELFGLLRLSEGEQLDSVGLVKRLGGGRMNFPSVARFAASPWLRGIAGTEKGRAELTKLAARCKGKDDCGIVSADWKQFAEFHYDGTIVYKQRYDDLQKEFPKFKDHRQSFEKIVAELEKMNGEPSPYLAVLVGDGDRMGKTIANLHTLAEHQRFSRLLTAFSRDVRGIAEGHLGHLVYSGGDDVLAFLPVDKAMECAREINGRFGNLMGGSDLQLQEQPTFSIGIGIGHFMEPMELLLSYAREAEKLAKKPEGNGLALHFHPRSGTPLLIRGEWGGDEDIHRRLKRWVELFQQGVIPDRAAFQLRELALDYAEWENDSDTRTAIRKDILRLLKRKEREEEEGGFKVTELGPDIERAVKSASSPSMEIDDSTRHHAGVMQLATEWLICRRIAAICDQAQGIRTDERHISTGEAV